jgi:hypothetical protein
MKSGKRSERLPGITLQQFTTHFVVEAAYLLKLSA